MAKVVLENVYKIYPAKSPPSIRRLPGNPGPGFVVLVGPSGCGKSTHAALVAGLEDISKGAFYIDGKKGQRHPAQGPRHRDGLPELRALSHMSVYNNMAFGLKLRKYPKARSTSA